MGWLWLGVAAILGLVTGAAGVVRATRHLNEPLIQRLRDMPTTETSHTRVSTARVPISRLNLFSMIFLLTSRSNVGFRAVGETRSCSGCLIIERISCCG